MIKIQRYLNFPISPGYYHRWTESGGGIELKKKGISFVRFEKGGAVDYSFHLAYYLSTN